MRRVHLLVTAGAVLPAVVLTACSGKPNDLRHYRDTETSTTVAAAPPQAAVEAGPPSTPVTPAPPAAARLALSAADLADEEVRPAGAPRQAVQAALPDCGVALRPAGTATEGYQTTWTYSTGSTLRQYVAVYDGSAAAVVNAVRAGLDCSRYQADGVEYRVDPPFDLGKLSGADAQLGWCSRAAKQSACTLLVAVGPKLTVLTVSASTEARARTAVTRLAPRTVTALRRT